MSATKSRKRQGFRPIGVITFLLLNLTVFGLSCYAIKTARAGLRSDNNDTCEYRADGATLAYGLYGLAMSVVGVASVFSSWRTQQLRNIFMGMFVAFGLAIPVTLIRAEMTISVWGFDGKLKPGWLGKPIVNNEHNWGEIKACFQKKEICKPLFSDPSKEPDTGLQMNCCRPPRHCSYQLRNGSYWSVGKNDPECNEWKERQGDVCFECESFKIGYLLSVNDPWMMLGSYNILVWLCLAISKGVAEKLLLKPNDDDGGSIERKHDAADVDIEKARLL